MFVFQSSPKGNSNIFDKDDFRKCLFIRAAAENVPE